MTKDSETHALYQTHLRLLGFTDAEVRAFVALLKTDPAGVSEIARTAKMPRTTVDAALRRLSARGLVRKLPHSYKSMWKVKKIEKIKDDASKTVHFLERENKKEATEKTMPEEAVGGIDAEEIGIEVFKGIPQIKKVYSEILKLGRADRVYFIQGNQSAKTVFEKIEKEYFYGFHKRLKQRGIIMEGIAGEAILDIFKHMDFSLLRSHFGRLLIGKVVPNEYMDFNLDIFVMRDKTFFVSISREIAIIVRFQPIIEMLFKVCEAFSALGRKIDLNAYLRELIEKRSDEQ